MRGGRGKRGRKGKKGNEKGCGARLSRGTSMSDEDEPALSPSATVVARRASREAKSMREKSPAAIGYTVRLRTINGIRCRSRTRRTRRTRATRASLTRRRTAGRGCTRCRERVRRREDGTGEEMRNALGLASAWERRVRSTEKTPPL